ncbi:hypothetical protein U1Q18_041478 [Sarracenia purpurea var. burkii]
MTFRSVISGALLMLYSCSPSPFSRPQSDKVPHIFPYPNTALGEGSSRGAQEVVDGELDLDHYVDLPCNVEGVGPRTLVGHIRQLEEQVGFLCADATSIRQHQQTMWEEHCFAQWRMDGFFFSTHYYS